MWISNAICRTFFKQPSRLIASIAPHSENSMSNLSTSIVIWKWNNVKDVRKLDCQLKICLLVGVRRGGGGVLCLKTFLGHRGPCIPYKPCNRSLYIWIPIFPRKDNTIFKLQLTYRKLIKRNTNKWRHQLSWVGIGDSNSTVYKVYYINTLLLCTLTNSLDWNSHILQ